MSILDVKNLNITIKEQNKIIDKDINFNINAGEIFVLVGESGSGKTMLIKAITGLINRKNIEVEGNIYLEGSDMVTLSEKKRRKYSQHISLIMQNPMTAFDPSVKIGKQMIEAALIFTKRSKKELLEEARRALKSVNLNEADNILNMYPHELSGGMLQRIMIAISILSNSKLVIADEPTTALDVITQEYILDEIIKLKNKNIAILLVTHDFYVAKKIADKIGVIRGGKIVEIGKAKDVLENPNHEYTKMLFEATTMHKLKR